MVQVSFIYGRVHRGNVTYLAGDVVSLARDKFGVTLERGFGLRRRVVGHS